MIGYHEGRTWLHAAHPFTVLMLTATIAGAVFLVPGPEGGGPPSVLLFVVGVVLAAGLGSVVLRPALITSAPFWLFLFLIHAVFSAESPGDTVRLGVGNVVLELSRSGLGTTLAAGSRITALVTAFLLMLAVTHPARLVEALVERGWPIGPAYLFAATLNAVPQLRARAARIIEAQRCRGLDPRRGLLGRWRAVKALALPLVLSAIHEVDEREMALESRALGWGGRRTPLAPPPDSPLQEVLRWVMVAALVGGVLARIYV